MLGAMMRAARGNMDADGFAELLSMMGMEVETAKVSRPDVPVAFQIAARTSSEPGADVVKIFGTMKDGSKIQALIVLVPHGSNTGKD